VKAKGGAYPGDRPCAQEGCPEAGDYRAPVHKPGSAFAAPSGPPEWQYFCLDHVRAFNAKWNYFEGLDPDTVWQQETAHPSWDRETRAFAHNLKHGGLKHGGGAEFQEEDVHSVLRWKQAAAAHRAASPLTREDRQALAKLGLADTATMDEVKAKYRTLARRYHPDANKGSREHEARFTALTEAYDHLAASQTFAKGGR
jgi:DnaJ-domain-containing protein 1